MKNTQVVIVGGGPVGLALAVAFGVAGVRCALIESRVTLDRIPKGQNLTQRTLEHFHFWGIEKELRAARIMPPDYPIGEITAYRDLMSEYWQAPAGRELVRPYYFADNDRLPQYQMEAVLRAKLATLPSVAARFGWTARALEQDADGVRVTIENAGGTREVLAAEYVVGCDGARSLVREAAGIAREGTDFEQRMVLAVFRSRELSERLRRFPPRSTYRVMHPDLKGYWKFFGRIDTEEGWFFHAPLPPDAGENPDIPALLHAAAGFPFRCEFDHLGYWDLRVAVAERYRAGRAFIAGDAAHSHPPYGGFGLNNGLEDAVNLGWKLAARLQDWGGDALLSSYDAERRPIFRDVADEFIAARIARDAAFLARHNPDHDRADFERAWKARETDIGDRSRAYAPNYEGSAVVAGPPGGVSRAYGTHAFTARAGHHLAPRRLSSGSSVFETLGEGFTLLAFERERAADAFARAARRRRIPLKIVRDDFRDERTDYAARLVLVRPDQFVAWAGDDAPPDTAALLRKVTGT
ncbi:MAG: FAD-dependent monooxygenase [Alphaproteobacteria bacterium]|nr:FAD-dependent monooxygenase [Alphaproteobacteria bacterium]